MKNNQVTMADGQGAQREPLAAPGEHEDAGAVVKATRWCPEEVGELMRNLIAAPAGRSVDASLLQQQLSLAYLAGASSWREQEATAGSDTPLALKAIEQAQTLLKNRAASQADRLSHAFALGRQTASASRRFGAAQTAAARSAQGPLKLFIRQPFTESGEAQQALVSQVLDRIDHCNGRPRPFHYLTGRHAESSQTFRGSFEAETGLPFTPHTFRVHRLGLLSQADAFINIRVSMSESSAFELAYHVFSGTCAPVLFLVWKQASIKTTLLKELDQICDVTYLEFEHADELEEGIAQFFDRCGAYHAVAA